VIDVDATNAAFPLAIDPVWAQPTKLTVEADNAAEYFGSEVSVSGNTALIAAPRNDEIDDDAGAAFVFVNTGGTWVLQQKLLAPDGAERDFFGTSVSLSDDTAVVGARGDDDAGSSSGAAYVFVRSGSTWTLEQKLVAPMPRRSTTSGPRSACRATPLSSGPPTTTSRATPQARSTSSFGTPGCGRSSRSSSLFLRPPTSVSEIAWHSRATTRWWGLSTSTRSTCSSAAGRRGPLAETHDRVARDAQGVRVR